MKNINPPNSGQDPAVDMLRQKISQLYSGEPSAKEELIEAEAAGRHRSKHQQFMHQLSTSGRSLAEIQTAWHNYYVGLPDKEKHAVWQEFYSEHSGSQQPPAARHNTTNQPHQSPPHPHHAQVSPASDPRSVADIKSHITKRVRNRNAKSTKKTHLKSMLFGLSMGAFAMLFLLFGFFNERFLAPFITPSKSVSNSPIVIDPGTSSVGAEPKIIIPKINVELPVIYDQPSIEEKDIQQSLESGVVHYATTSNPGEKGNGVIFGHSSNNILNKGKYKFAFVLLKQLEPGDTFYLQKDSKRYVYKVSEKKIVKPTDVSILYTQSAKPTITLVTCDPPGTSLNRLLVIGEQITPDPGKNIASTAKKDVNAIPQVIPSNAPSLWQRVKGWFTS